MAMKAAGAGFLILVLAALPLLMGVSVLTDAQQQALPNQDVVALVNAVRSAGFNTAALIIAYARDVLQPPLTLFIPNDQAIAATAMDLPPLSASPTLLRSLVQVHMVVSNLSFSDLRALPVNTLLPTMRPGTRLQVTNNSPNSYMLENAHVLGTNICPNIDSVTCFGISDVFNVSGLF